MLTAFWIKSCLEYERTMANAQNEGENRKEGSICWGWESINSHCAQWSWSVSESLIGRVLLGADMIWTLRIQMLWIYLRIVFFRFMRYSQMTICYFFIPKKPVESRGNIHYSLCSCGFFSINHLAQQNPVRSSEGVLDIPRLWASGLFHPMMTKKIFTVIFTHLGSFLSLLFYHDQDLILRSNRKHFKKIKGMKTPSWGQICGVMERQLGKVS